MSEARVQSQSCARLISKGYLSLEGEEKENPIHVSLALFNLPLSVLFDSMNLTAMVQVSLYSLETPSQQDYLP